jgi:hypothetical protein
MSRGSRHAPGTPTTFHVLERATGQSFRRTRKERDPSMKRRVRETIAAEPAPPRYVTYIDGHKSMADYARRAAQKTPTTR